MKWQWKIVVAVAFLLVLILVLNIGLNWWIKFQLPKIINEKNESSYVITYKKIDVSLLDSNIKANDIVIIPKTALTDTINKSGIYAKVKSVEVKEFKLWSLLFSDKIKARSITINTPKLILYKKSQKTGNYSSKVRSSVVAPFEKIIAVSDIYLDHGDIKIIDFHTNAALLSVQNVKLQLNGIIITETILKNTVPFYFQNYAFTCDSLYYRASNFYHVKTHVIKASKSDLIVNHFELIPEYSRAAFVKKIPQEKDLFTVLSTAIVVQKMKWGFKQQDFFFHSQCIALNDLTANIYRSKIPADDLKKKPLYNKLLRDLKFDLKLDTLKITNALLQYEEEKSFDKGAGKLSFNKFNLTATHIRSGFKQQKLADLEININCRFMNTSPLSVNWRFNVMDKSDGFKIKGAIRNFEIEKIIPFSKPYMNVTAKGILNEMHFNFIGNDRKNQGTFSVKYDDLKLTVYKKEDRKKKNKLLTFVANLFVKNDTKKKLKEAQINVDRIPEKSFYNFLWRSIAEGLEKILI